MAQDKFYSRIRHKIGKETEWALATNFIPLKGELIIYTDVEGVAGPMIKIGDGSTKVSDLKFIWDETLTTVVENLIEGYKGYTDIKIDEIEASIANTIAGLGGSISGSGFVSSISQTDGKVTATLRTLTASDIPSHKSTSTKYGVGDSDEYGHLRLSDTVSSSSTLNNDDGYAATPYAVGVVQKNLESEISARKNADESLSNEINTIIPDLGTGSVDDRIDAAKSELADDISAVSDSNIEVRKEVYGTSDGSTASTSRIDTNESNIAAINAKITAMNVTDSAVAKQLVSEVDQTDGIIKVTRRALLAADIPSHTSTKKTTYGAGAKGTFGHVRLLTSVESTLGESDGTAATPSAVKTAYDKAANAVSAAAAAQSTADEAKSAAATAQSTADSKLNADGTAVNSTQLNGQPASYYATAANLTTVQSTANAAKDQAATNKSAISALTETVSDNLTAAKEYAESLASNYDGAGSADQALESAKDYTDDEITDVVKAYQAADSAIKTAYADADAQIRTDYAAADAEVLSSAKSDATTKANNALTSAKSYTDTEIAEVTKAYQAADSAIKTLVDTLIDDDTNMSVREIAAEETAKIVAGADTKYDTLKEIADWIGSDTSGAAAMANDITAITKEVYGTSDGSTASTSRIDTNESNIATINSKISAMKLSDSAVAKQLVSEVDQTDGKITVTRRALVAADIPNHASTATTYGAGSDTNYGHLKLSASTSSTSGVSGGIAATPSAVKAVKDALDTEVARVNPIEVKSNNTNITYATCTTAAGTAEKVITLANTNSKWTLTTGAVIIITFTNTNTAANPTFNVNGTGALSVYYEGVAITSSSLGYGGTKNRAMIYVYDGTGYRFAGWGYDGNTNTQVRAYRQGDSGWNKDYPLLASRTVRSSIGSATEDKYTAIYSLVPTDSDLAPTVNPHTGLVKVASLKVDGDDVVLKSAYDDWVAGLDYTDTAVAKQLVSEVDQVDGKISVTRRALVATDIPAHTSSTGSTYGLATGSVYGHVKLTDTISSSSAASTGIAPSQKAVSDLVTSAKNAAATTVTQNAAITTSGSYPLLLGYSTATTAVTNTVNKTSTLLYNPSTGLLSTKALSVTAGTSTFAGGHLYLSGSNASSSTANTTQVVFGTSSTQHVAVTANDNALVMNPTTNSKTNQIILYLNQQSKFPSGVNAGNLSVTGTSAFTGAITASGGATVATSLKATGVFESTGPATLKSTLAVTGAATFASTVKIGEGVTLSYDSTNECLNFIFD